MLGGLAQRGARLRVITRVVLVTACAAVLTGCASQAVGASVRNASARAVVVRLVTDPHTYDFAIAPGSTAVLTVPSEAAGSVSEALVFRDDCSFLGTAILRAGLVIHRNVEILPDGGLGIAAERFDEVPLDAPGTAACAGSEPSADPFQN